MTNDEALARIGDLDAATGARKALIDAKRAECEAAPDDAALHAEFVALHADVIDGKSMFGAMQERAQLVRALS